MAKVERFPQPHKHFGLIITLWSSLQVFYRDATVRCMDIWITLLFIMHDFLKQSAKYYLWVSNPCPQYHFPSFYSSVKSLELEPAPCWHHLPGSDIIVEGKQQHKHQWTDEVWDVLCRELPVSLSSRRFGWKRGESLLKCVWICVRRASVLCNWSQLYKQGWGWWRCSGCFSLSLCLSSVWLYPSLTPSRGPRTQRRSSPR